MTDDDRPQESVGPRQRRHPDAFADLNRSALAALDRLSYRELGQIREQDLLRIARLGHVALDQATHSLKALMSPQPDLLTGIAESVAGRLEAHQREMAALRPWLGLQTSSIESIVGNIGAPQRELLDAMQPPRFNLPASSLESAMGDIGARQRELLDAMRPPRFDFPASSIASVVGDIGARQRELLDAMQPPRFDFPASIALGISAWSDLRPVLPNLLADDLRRLDVGLTDDILELLGVRSSLHTDSFLNDCIDDIYLLLSHDRPVSAIDRAHTALHQALRLLAREVVGRPAPDHRKVRLLCRFVCQGHPIFLTDGGRAINLRLAERLSDIVTELTQLRNSHSFAHPTDALAPDAVALSVVRRALTVIDQLAERHSQYIERSVRDRYRYN